MSAKEISKGKSTYRVTATVYVEAQNMRHAAHIAAGAFAAREEEERPQFFTVEERTSQYGQPYLVDINASGAQPVPIVD